MATYGKPNSQIPFTGWSPTLAVGTAAVGSTSGAAQFNGLTQEDYFISTLLLNNQANRATRQLFYALLGVATGAVANAPYIRVQAQQAMNSPFDMGGIVPIESTTYINRATTAADVSNLQAFLNRMPGPASYPPDLSGNGGAQGFGGTNSKVIW